MNKSNALEFETGSGMCYGILGVQASDVAVLQSQLPPAPTTAYVTSDGGLISNLRVGENLILPATYHSGAAPEEYEQRIVSILTACRYDSEAIGQLIAKLPADLSTFEKRLVGFMRAAILQPAVIVYDSLWADLSAWEYEQVIGFDAILRSGNQDVVSLYLHSGISFPFEVAFDQTFVL